LNAVEREPGGWPIGVATYNIRYANPRDGKDIWPDRKEAVAKFLSQRSVFGLQEATAPQIKDLTSRLPDHDWYGVGREDGKERGEAVPIFYRRDRFSVQSKETIWLSKTPDVIGSKGWDAALPRTMTWMVLVDRESSQKLLVANTHFDHRGEEARLESAKLVNRFLAEKGKGMPIILMGDFNCLPDSDPYKTIVDATQECPLMDARQRSLKPPAGPSSTWNGFKSIEPNRIIDHVFVSRNLDVFSYKVLNPYTEAGRFASDHLPIEVLVQLQEDKP
jgi:endonuclease/exonuclease/phosphatase family metal-dependent hydrolase